MSDFDSDIQILNLTAKGVEFAPWYTEVENDNLVLAKVVFEEPSPLVNLIQEGLRLSLPNPRGQNHILEATFISTKRQAVIRFGFDGVIAYRVLDEDGLDELWHASAATPRPTASTFRARGHKWAGESPLVFLDVGFEPRFSYFVATHNLCLEVVCCDEPSVMNIGPAVVTKA